MVQMAMLLFGFPIGFFGRWSRRSALVVTTALFLIILIPQTVLVSADNPDEPNLGYWIIQAITLAVGLALTLLGHQRGRARRTAAT